MLVMLMMLVMLVMLVMLAMLAMLGVGVAERLKYLCFVFSLCFHFMFAVMSWCLKHCSSLRELCCNEAASGRITYSSAQKEQKNRLRSTQNSSPSSSRNTTK